jgi:serine/threonine protein kinase/Flp pilus assembly protein TadD
MIVTPERWQQIDRILEDALDLNPAEWPEFLQNTCANDESLRNEILLILQSLHGEEKFLETPPENEINQVLFQKQNAIPESIGPYRILNLLGKGGMGEVYRAIDTRLDRKVAIKVLPQHLMTDPAALKLFHREAKAIAALNHPNILAIYEFDSTNSISFVVTELLEGETLRVRIGREPLEPKRALEIAIAAAKGLSAAHSKGVIHRDLKPENIFLTSDSGVKILDFGLARVIPAISEEEITKASTKSVETAPGIIRGTIPYMSPEQLQGNDVDARTDIFSFGSVFYEMLTGVRAFHKSSNQETIQAILHQEPHPLSEKIPLSIRETVSRCLKKERAQRFTSTQELLGALEMAAITETGPRPKIHQNRRVLSAGIALAIVIVLLSFFWSPLRQRFFPAPSIKIRSLAVLPLKNLSGDPKQDYFADGMTEELIARLASIKSLRVISRTSVIEYRNPRKPLPEIAKDLNVDAIVEGSVLYAGQNVRITAQLIEGSTDRHLWADSYEGEIANIFALQNQVARAIAEEIRITLNPNESALLSASTRVTPAAYQAYLRGIEFTRSPDLLQGWKQATEMFEQAVSLDPQFAKAFAQLGEAHSAMFHFKLDISQERLQKAKVAIDRAFQLHPGLAEAHRALGFYYYFGQKDLNQALKEFSTAQKDLPNDIRVLEGIALIYRRQGNLDASIANFKRIMELNPLDSVTPFSIGEAYTIMRNYAEADHYYDRSIALDPGQKNSYGSKAQNYLLWKGSIKDARAMLEKIRGKEDAFDILQAYWVEIYDRKYEAALDRLSGLSVEAIQGLGTVIPKSELQSLAYLWMGKTKEAQFSLAAARTVLEELAKQQPDNAAVHSSLGIVYAGLSQKQRAVSEAKLATKLRPVSNNIYATVFIIDLAHVYTIVGEYDLAVDQIEYLLTVPSYFISIPILKIDPRWDPLRSHPRFQKLLAQS